ncbi:MAG: histidine phosphatase family protein [Lapillicoccus sp.]
MSRATADRTLVLVRHAKAEQVPGRPDHDRALTDRGHRDALIAGQWLHEQGIVPDLVICSTSVRTRQTWTGISRGGCHTEFVEYRRVVYEGSGSRVLEVIREDAGELQTVLVIGHAPSIPDLASALTDGEGTREGHLALADGFPTCGVAILRYAGDWADLGAAEASLERFHVCRA